MNGAAVAFQPTVEGGVTKAPAEYRGQRTRPVRVVVTPEKERARSRVIPRQGNAVLTGADFSAMRIATKGWKFDRDEANAR